MRRVTLAVALLAVSAGAQPITKGTVNGHLTSLCAAISAAQSAYYKAAGRHFRCVPTDYSIDGCADALNPAQLSKAMDSQFRVDIWNGGAGNGNGDGYSCAATFGNEEKRLAPTSRAGRDGKPPTTIHRAANAWRPKGVEVEPVAKLVEPRAR